MYIIDLQGFQYKKELAFTCKEISIFNINDKSCVNRIVKPKIPYKHLRESVKIQIDWTVNHVHGLRWSSSWDNLPYSGLGDFISDSVLDEDQPVLVKGWRKRDGWSLIYLIILLLTWSRMAVVE
jgi:hypothetical protein